MKYALVKQLISIILSVCLVCGSVAPSVAQSSFLAAPVGRQVSSSLIESLIGNDDPEQKGYGRSVEAVAEKIEADKKKSAMAAIANLTSLLGEPYENKKYAWIDLIMRIVFVGGIVPHVFGYYLYAKLRGIEVETHIFSTVVPQKGQPEKYPDSWFYRSGYILNLIVLIILEVLSRAIGDARNTGMVFYYLLITNISTMIMQIMASLFNARGFYNEAKISSKNDQIKDSNNYIHIFLKGIIIATSLYLAMVFSSASMAVGIGSAVALIVIFLDQCVPMPDELPDAEKSFLPKPILILKLKFLKLAIDEYKIVKNAIKTVRGVRKNARSIRINKQGIRKSLPYAVCAAIGIAILVVGIAKYNTAHPWLTSMIMTGIIMGFFTELLSQRLIDQDTERSIKRRRLIYKTVMFFVLGFVFKAYFNVLDGTIPSDGAWREFKVVVDQFLWSSWLFMPNYILLSRFFERLIGGISKKQETFDWQNEIYQRTILALPIWVLAHIFNFHMLENESRVVFANVIAFVFFTILAVFDKARNKAETVETVKRNEKPVALGTTRRPAQLIKSSL